MTTATTLTQARSMEPATLHVALELGQRTWKVGSALGFSHRPRERTVSGGDGAALLRELLHSKRRFGLPPDAPVVCGYEAGPEGFWLYRFLRAHGIECLVVDAASIEVNRKRRRAKTDRLDMRALLRLLLRYRFGERTVWRVVHVPDIAAEDRRHPHREFAALTEERTRVRNRIRGLLKTQGVALRKGTRWQTLGAWLETAPRWDGRCLEPRLRERLGRELQRLALLDAQRRAIQAAMVAELKALGASAGPAAMMQRLIALRGIGVQISRVLVMELFAWRDFTNRKQVGGCVGFDATPYQSGQSMREQGISKAGNVWVRRVLIQLAWAWVRAHPDSALTQWFRVRFATGGRQQRARGIVALARKLLIALWRYVHGGPVPVGASVGAADVYVLAAH